MRTAAVPLSALLCVLHKKNPSCCISVINQGGQVQAPSAGCGSEQGTGALPAGAPVTPKSADPSL